MEEQECQNASAWKLAALARVALGVAVPSLLWYGVHHLSKFQSHCGLVHGCEALFLR